MIGSHENLYSWIELALYRSLMRWPMLSLELVLRPLRRHSLATVVPLREAILLSVSPLRTRYVDDEAWAELDVDDWRT